MEIDLEETYSSMLRSRRCKVCPVMCECWDTKEECEKAILEMRHIFKLCKKAKVYAHRLILGGKFAGYEAWCREYEKKFMKT